MIASQDEVPDLSFPYDNLIQLFGKHGADLPSLLADGVKLYVTTYQDNVCNNTTEINPVTLSVLKLENCGTREKPGVLNEALRFLACALLKANDEAKKDDRLQKDLQEVLIEARKSCKDYAGGLYVDLYDFCEKLVEQLTKLKEKQEKEQKALTETEAWIKDIGDPCGSVKTALSPGGDSLVLQNGSVEISEDGKNAKVQVNGSEISADGEHANAASNAQIRNHGISIYLPYLTDDQYAQVQRPLVKGGRLTGKGFGEALRGAGIEYLMYGRRDLILDTESYYARLRLADETKWYDFITEVWTRALMDRLPADLDYHYSAQQSWMNVTRNRVNIDELCGSEPGPNPKVPG